MTGSAGRPAKAVLIDYRCSDRVTYLVLGRLRATRKTKVVCRYWSKVLGIEDLELPVSCFWHFDIPYPGTVGPIFRDPLRICRVLFEFRTLPGNGIIREYDETA